ncbi:neuropeptides capa receptor-like [Leptopilina heterotoma]|uniref:neuropeptides capa receptor-like n=1 Tax=Leptopilina heterotoma TaxID=63436 RepID=UPI001CA96B7A|nr:neuropeptides capa receptor-like [Leptopilina heterotoma]
MTLRNIELLDSSNSSTNSLDDISNIWEQTETYLQILASIVGLVINLITIYVIGRKRHVQKTNSYLISLAVCNITVLILNLIKEFKIDSLHQTYVECKTFPYLQQVILSAIVMHFLILIIYWYKYTRCLGHSKLFVKQNPVILLLILLFSFIGAIPFSYFNVISVKSLSEGNEQSLCNQTMPKYVQGIWTLIFFIIPMIIILILFFGIRKNIRESISMAGYSSNQEAINFNLKQIYWRKRAVTFLLLAVATLFVFKFPEVLYYTLISCNIISASDSRWNSFYIASFYIYTAASAILFILTSIRANSLTTLKCNEKVDSRSQNESQSMSIIVDENNHQ